MATPQRQFPNDREPERRRPASEPVRAGGRSWFWIWIVLFIAAIIWFAGWGFGGYGGWWWGRTHGPTITQPTNSTGSTPAAAPNGGTAAPGGSGSAAPGTAPTSNGNGTAAPGGTTTGPRGNGTTGGGGTAGTGSAPRGH